MSGLVGGLVMCLPTGLAEKALLLSRMVGPKAFQGPEVNLEEGCDSVKV